MESRNFIDYGARARAQPLSYLGEVFVIESVDSADSIRFHGLAFHWTYQVSRA